MLPPIPPQLSQVDESTVDQHFLLRAGDPCYYLWEYTAGRHFDFSPANQLIRNLKIKPSWLRQSPKRAFYKQQAIAHCAAGLRHFLSRRFVEQQAAFIPVPGSKAADHVDHDTRMLSVLQQAFHGWAADIRPMLEFARSIDADHETAERISYADLLAIARLNDPANATPRPILVVVDDVLNSGKHFKVAQTLLSQRHPGAEIRGLFVARCVHERASTAVPDVVLP